MKEIEVHQRVIDGARTVVENYRPYKSINPDWPVYSVGVLAENLDFRRVPVSKGHRSVGPFPCLGTSGIVDYIFGKDILPVSEHWVNLLARSKPLAF